MFWFSVGLGAEGAEGWGVEEAKGLGGGWGGGLKKGTRWNGEKDRKGEGKKRGE